MDLHNIKEEDLTYFGERAEPYFASHAIISGMQNSDRSMELFGVRSTVRWLQLNYFFYQFTEDLLREEEEITKKIRQNGNHYVDGLIDQCIQAGNTLVEESVRLGDSAHSLITKADMAKAILDYYRAASSYTIFYQLTFFDRPEMALAEEVAGKNSTNKQDASKILHQISLVDRPTAAEYEQDDFLMLAIAPEKDRDVLAEQHAQKYGWLSVRYFLGDTWTKEDVLKRLAGVSREQSKRDLEDRLAHRQEREIELNGIIKNFSGEDREFVKQLRKVIYLRTQRGDFIHESAARVRPLMQKIADDLNVTYLELINLSAPEIARALNGDDNYRRHIENRNNNFLIFHDWQRNGTVLEGKEVDSYVDTHPFLRVKTKNVSEFFGKIGYKGNVSGVAKLVKLNTDIHKVNAGDIIFTTMTTSNLMPALEKAAAFITDEGGITCHAAIIAREMKKPCVIGTKIATRVLRDGDEVEVNANDGVVKILKRAK